MEANGKNYAPIHGKIPGKELTLGGHVFTAAPLNLDGLQGALPLIDELKKIKDIRDVIKGAAPIVHLSLARNYDITVEDVIGLLDAGNVTPALYAIAGISGLETGPGETKPAPR